VNWLFTVDGEAARTDFMDGIDTTWARFEGGKEVAAALDEALAAFQPRAPEKSLPGLLKARRAMAAMTAAEAKERLAELDEAIAAAAGLHFEAATSEKWAQILGSVEVSVTAIARGKVNAEVGHVVVGGVHVNGGGLGTNTVWTRKQTAMSYAPRHLSRPYYAPVTDTPGRYRVQGLSLLGEPVDPPVIRAQGRFVIDGVEIDLWRDVEYVRVDRAKGEVREPLEAMPPVSVELDSAPILFLDSRPKEISVEVVGLSNQRTGSVSLESAHPGKFGVTPWSQSYTLPESGRVTLKYQLTPPDQPGTSEIRAIAHLGSGEYSARVVRLAYDHIMPRTVLAQATVKVVRADVRTLSKRIGYIMGAGDEVTRALEQMGCEVILLERADLEKGDLSRFDAIVTGVRAFNVREDLRRNSSRLWEYARQGGTVVVQYNVMDGQFWSNEPGTLNSLGPYPVRLSRDRVTVEEAPVKLVLPDHPLLNAPNKIVAADWEGWIQERGLYFAGKWDAKYETPLEMNDPGEAASRGSLLTARVGKGAYVMTGLSFFRQLPAGVPGAYRLFANLISAGKSQ
jgi:hypothetical protein